MNENEKKNIENTNDHKEFRISNFSVYDINTLIVCVGVKTDLITERGKINYLTEVNPDLLFGNLLNTCWKNYALLFHAEVLPRKKSYLISSFVSIVMLSA